MLVNSFFSNKYFLNVRRGRLELIGQKIGAKCFFRQPLLVAHVINQKIVVVKKGLIWGNLGTFGWSSIIIYKQENLNKQS